MKFPKLNKKKKKMGNLPAKFENDAPKPVSFRNEQTNIANDHRIKTNEGDVKIMTKCQVVGLKVCMKH